MTDDELLAAVQELVGDQPDRAVTTGEVAEKAAISDLDEVTIQLERLRSAGQLFRAVGTDDDHPPAVIAYTLTER